MQVDSFRRRREKRPPPAPGPRCFTSGTCDIGLPPSVTDETSRVGTYTVATAPGRNRHIHVQPAVLDLPVADDRAADAVVAGLGVRQAADRRRDE